ncbi:unnamed protein product [Paramecium sonneborni]|uniref:Uncharacterized protein n=1 Tax=Paramecium sonneborni TaxID=65129 RepID=A0A8S1LPY2_9CILI|nr:unnamed protein product [Paramecium sonneborni]
MNKNKGVSKDVQHHNFQKKNLKIVPQQNLNAKIKQPDLNRKLLAMPIDAKYKAVLGPDTDSLVAYLKHKKKKQKAIQKYKDLGQILEEPKQEVDKLLPEEIYETDEGKLNDVNGKIIHKINKNIQKLLRKVEA